MMLSKHPFPLACPVVPVKLNTVANAWNATVVSQSKYESYSFLLAK